MIARGAAAHRRPVPKRRHSDSCISGQGPLTCDHEQPQANLCKPAFGVVCRARYARVIWLPLSPTVTVPRTNPIVVIRRGSSRTSRGRVCWTVSARRLPSRTSIMCSQIPSRRCHFQRPQIQQDLARPGVLERFAADASEAELLRACFAGAPHPSCTVTLDGDDTARGQTCGCGGRTPGM